MWTRRLPRRPKITRDGEGILLLGMVSKRRLEVQKNRGGGPNNLPGVPSSEKLRQRMLRLLRLSVSRFSCCTKVDSAFRNRSVEENLRLFEEMQAGKHAEGSLLLRAKIDMNHPNMNMRDPPMPLELQKTNV